jgi:hypothetical protein
MDSSVLQNGLDRLTESFMAKVYPDAGVCQRRAAGTLFNALVRGGSTLVTRLSAFAGDGGKTAPKGVRERVSWWLENYDFAGPAADWMSARFAGLVTEDTAIAVDFSDISKEFGGKGMEGMQRGWDGSRKTTAMGHTFCAAAAVSPSRDRVRPLGLCLEKGRKPLFGRMTRTLDSVYAGTEGKGVPVIDRGGDSEDLIGFLLAKGRRAVIRINKLDRDVFGTGNAIDKELAAIPQVPVTLHKKAGSVKAQVRWKKGLFGPLRLPILMAESMFGDTALRLCVLLGKDAETEDPAKLRKYAEHAAQAYLDRWQIEVFFERVKQDFALEAMRVRTFRRLVNLFCLCVLGYVFCTHIVPEDASRHGILKAFRDNFQRVSLSMQVFLSGLRALLEEPRLRFITGRPRKPPNIDTSQMLFAWE